MFTILAFLLTIAGSINWLLIGLLQYDYVAGIFGYQGSVFSRLIYIIVGASCFVLVWKLIKGKGTLAVFSRRNKKDMAKQISKVGQKAANIEAGKENVSDHYGDSGERFSPPQEDEEQSQGLLDDEIKD